MENGVIRFSAEGMRKLTNQSQHSLENKEFENTKDKIIAAAQQGHYSLNLTLDYPITIKALQVLGFKIRHTNEDTICYSVNKAPNYYEVSWFDKWIPYW